MPFSHPAHNVEIPTLLLCTSQCWFDVFAEGEQFYPFKKGCNTLNAAGPIPCSFWSSTNVKFRRSFSLAMPAAVKALLAGAPTLARIPFSGFFSFSHMGQTGQSLDL
ncbi:MAG: hypothetical protein ACKVOK_14960 [Flavobacteriales bacterium]